MILSLERIVTVCQHLIAQRPNYEHSLLVYLVKQNDWLNYVADRLSIDLRNLLLKIPEKWINIFLQFF